jgi:N-methylhydantoinase A
MTDSPIFRLGCDIGGTFTDFVLLNQTTGQFEVHKTLTTPKDPSEAVDSGVEALLSSHPGFMAQTEHVIHGTTLVINAIIERKGARTAIIATKGFRDVLEMRREIRYDIYDIDAKYPTPLVLRPWRREVNERTYSNGEVLIPLDEGEARALLAELAGAGIESVAVCLLHSYANPSHEQTLARLAAEAHPELSVSLSSEVLPEIKEYERTSTTVMNAYVMPIVGRYLASLRENLDRIGIGAPLLLMQSNGGLTTEKTASRMPVNIIESGPAAGVIGAQALAKALHLPNIITFDMGGTTAKASLVENGEVTRSPEHQVGGGIMVGSRLLTGAGYLLKVPLIDLAEVGAGGGSHVWIDAGGSLQIGPHSAGASPGPVCYDQGGTVPTVTDASVILGYLNPDFLVGGALRLNAEKARSVFEAQIALPLGLELAHAAYGAHQIASSNMIRAIRAVSTERGRDPRDYALFAFGGNGPIFAAAMAEALKMRRIVVPPSPGLFSSFGLLYTNVEHHYSRTFRRLLRQVELEELNRVWEGMVDEARQQLAADGFRDGQVAIRRAANLHYQGQTFELTVPLPEGPLTTEGIPALEEAFGQEHERTYGHRAGPEEPVEIVNIMVVGQGLFDKPRVPERIRPSRLEATAALAPRQAYFGLAHGWLETPVVRRSTLARPVEGPCIVEEYDATCVVPPRARAELDRFGNILITLPEAAPAAARSRSAGRRAKATAS